MNINKCEWCGKELSPAQVKDKRRFCSTSCSAKWRTTNFDYHKKKSLEGTARLSAALKERWNDSSFRENNHRRMIENNPARRPDYRDKVVQTVLSKSGYCNNFVAGNGKVSNVEMLVYDALIEMGFVYNFAIPTSEAISAFPERHYAKNYKPDFTLVGRRVCVELDGDDHDPELDAKKDECLNYLGFKVYRFTNDQVKKDPQRIIEEVSKIVRQGNK